MLFFLVIGVYSVGIGGPLVFDDYGTIQPLLNLGLVPHDWRAYVISPTGPLGRPISMLSFLANLHWTGDKLWLWKLTNITLHCVIGLLLLGVGRRLFLIANPGSPRDAEIFAFITMALWLLHPLHPSTVLYTVQRMTQLSALFTVAGILAYLIARTRKVDNFATRALLWGSCLVCLPLAALSKESGLLLPAYLAVLELTVLHEVGLPGVRRHSRVLLLFFLVVPVAIGGSYLATHFSEAILQPHLRRGFSLWERLLTESRVVIHYLGLIIAPSRRALGFFHDDITLSTGLLAPLSTLGAIIGLASLLVGGWWLRFRLPLVSCGILWFFAGHLMESTIIPLELMFEHRNYLPSFGIIVSLVGAMTLSSIAPLRRLRTTIAIAVLTLFTAVTYSITRDWRDELSLYTAGIEAHPRSPIASSQLAEFYTVKKRYSDALTTLAAIPDTGATIQRWYIACKRDGRIPDNTFDVAVLALENSLSTYSVSGMVELANLGLDDHCRFQHEQFLELLDGALALPMRLKDNRQKLLLYAAHFEWKLKRFDSAIERLERLRELIPEEPVPLLLMSEWLLEVGDITRGRQSLRHAEHLAAKSRKDYSKTLQSVRDLYSAKGTKS
ncbi:MAG: tetratricopeptide repeat protein [Gammaproteobacteria bacterium]|nr:tetratricopeptide repeat protein [Gammaproteobacteria bacterium]